MNKAASACDGLSQLASASASDEEASEQLMQALASTEPFPINLAWIVPLLNYKHISSLTTHLKRHFEKDEHFQKYSSGGARTHTYRISIHCFREICQFARHSQRRTLAQHWVKVIDDVAGDSYQRPNTNHRTVPKKKHKKGNNKTTKAVHHRPLPPASHNDDVDDVDDEDLEGDDTEDFVEEEDDIIIADGAASPPRSQDYDDDDDDGSDSDTDIEDKSSSLLNSLSSSAAGLNNHHNHHHYSPSKAAEVSPPPASPSSTGVLYNYTITTPTKRLKKDFANVSILNRKRKTFDESLPSGWSPTKIEPLTDDAVRRDNLSSARPNLRILSELALGLR